MTDCTAYLEENKVKDVCKHCKKDYIVRDDNNSIWQPATKLATGKCSYIDVPLCHNCRMELVTLIQHFIK